MNQPGKGLSQQLTKAVRACQAVASGNCSEGSKVEPGASGARRRGAPSSGSGLGLWQRTWRCYAGDEGMNGAMEELPQVAALAKAGFVGGDTPGDESIATQRSAGP